MGLLSLADDLEYKEKNLKIERLMKHRKNKGKKKKKLSNKNIIKNDIRVF